MFDPVLFAALMGSTALFSPSSLFSAGEQGAWYDPSDFSTMFQDSAGTTPVTAVEQPVGLVLDKSKGTPTARRNRFSSTQELNLWTLFGGATYTGTNVAVAPDGTTTADSIRVTTAGTGSNVYQAFTTGAITSNTWTMSVWVKRNAASDQSFQLFANVRGATPYGFSGDLTATDTWQRFTFTHTETGGTAGSVFGIIGNTSGITADLLVWGAQLEASSTASEYQKIVSGIGGEWTPGNHASQSTSASRPVLSARVNLLTYSEDFNNAAWTKIGSVTIATGITDPNGGSTATRLTANVANLFIYQNASAGLAIANTPSLWIRRHTGSGQITLRNGNVDVPQTVTSSWTRLAPSHTSVGLNDFVLQIVTSGDAIDVWHPDLRVTNDGVGIPAYQRVGAAVTATTNPAVTGVPDYDTSGFPLYLRFDGTDDSLATASIDFSATDKMSVFAGHRVVSGTGSQMICELGTNAYTSSGFAFGQGLAAATSGLGFLMNAGSGIAAQTADKSVPYTSVSSLLLDSAQSGISNEGILRSNTTSQTYTVTAGTDSGTANFPNKNLYIGNRSGASVWFNGRLYSLIVRGAQSTDAQIASTEAWVNNVTKGY